MRAKLHLALLRIFRLLPEAARVFVVHRLAPTFSVGAIAVVAHDDGAILLVRHSYRHRWGFPGGLLMRGEEAANATRREALEEVGVVVELLGEPTVVVAPGPRRVDVVYRARLAPGTDPADLRSRSPEIVAVGWFPADALPELQDEAATALVALARAVEPPQGPHPRPLVVDPFADRRQVR